MPSPRIEVEPRVLIWARRSAGLDDFGAANKIGVSESVLKKWESGDLAPTLVQLRKAGKVYKRPLAVLLLGAPPNERGFDALADFRILGEKPPHPSPALLAEFRRALAQREVLLHLHEIAPDLLAHSPALPELRSSIEPDAVGAQIREFVGVEVEQQKRASDPGAALNQWVGAVESKGILVLQTSGVAPSEMHGFSISEWPYPVIALNGSDHSYRRLFTLLHELAHLALRSGGVCDLSEFHGAQVTAEARLEHLCNAIAASALLPASEFQNDVQFGIEHEWPLHDLRALSRKYSVSSEAVLLRLINLGRASWDVYRARKPEIDRAYEEVKESQRQRAKAREGGPSFYLLKARDLGHGYASSVLGAYRSDRISSLDVADYLDIRFSQLASLEAVVR